MNTPEQQLDDHRPEWHPCYSTDCDHICQPNNSPAICDITGYEIEFIDVCEARKEDK